jgi:hypothetical protein
MLKSGHEALKNKVFEDVSSTFSITPVKGNPGDELPKFSH